MREVLFKNLTSAASRKKDVVLKEIFEKDGVVAKTERRCFYFIKEMMKLKDESDLQKWLGSQNQAQGVGKRNFHIMKEHKDGSGEDRVSCKIMGTFFAVVNRTVYTIAFLHSFKVVFMKASLTN